MKIHEYQAADIFKQAGISVIDGSVASDCDRAADIADKIGYPVVLKSQVLVGGRGKAGGIKIVRNKQDLVRVFGDLKKLTIKGCRVEKILVARAIDIAKEFYAGITIDNVRGDVVLIASSFGGIDIEEVAKTDLGAIQKFYLHGHREIDKSRWPEFIKGVFRDPAYREAGTDVFERLVKVFFRYDCLLAEINPLVIGGDGRMYAADAKINFDDSALFRHEEISSMRDAAGEDPDELEAREYGLSFVKLDGNVGCIVNGAGLAMGTMDIIKLSGGKPANFLDVGGSSSPAKVLNALKIILKSPAVKSVLINIFGGITRCDDIANGVLEARRQLDIPVPFVVRLTGTNEQEAKELLAKNNISTFSTMREAVDKAVALSK